MGKIEIDFENSLQVDTDYSYVENSDAEVAELSVMMKMMILLLSIVIPIFEKLL